MTHPDETRPTPDEVAWIDRALLRLPPTRRNIFLLNCKEGLTCDDIAELYGMSAKRVRWHVVEAMLHLRREQESVRRPWWRELLSRLF